MFDTLSISHLESMLTHFSFPMLIAERPDRHTEFRMVAMNAALEKIAGPKDAICGMILRDVFPPTVVDKVIQCFGPSGATENMQKFQSAIYGITGEVPCDLTLQYLRGPDGYDRVIVTAHQESAHGVDLQDKLAFEDVRYFSFIADLQLEKLNSAFISATENVQVTPIDEDRIMRLHAVCRTIQRTVSDIKNVVSQAQARHAAQGEAHIVRARSSQQQQKLTEGTNMFEALTEELPSERERATL